MVGGGFFGGGAILKPAQELLGKTKQQAAASCPSGATTIYGCVCVCADRALFFI